jgi:predicted small secreted protein
MKITINVMKKHLYLISLLIAVFVLLTFATARFANTDTGVGHDMNELDWTQSIPTLTVTGDVNIGGKASVTGGISTGISTTYVRWGRKTCESPATLVYEGYVGGSHYTHGGTSNILCLTKTPTWDVYDDGNHDGNLMYGAEYQTKGMGIAHLEHLHDKGVPCSVCLVEGDSTVLMHPGSQNCPTDWSRQYKGYLMGEKYTHAANGQTLCVDRDAEPIDASDTSNDDGSLFYPTEAEPWSLTDKYSEYILNREMTCSVCTR